MSPAASQSWDSEVNLKKIYCEAWKVRAFRLQTADWFKKKKDLLSFLHAKEFSQKD